MIGKYGNMLGIRTRMRFLRKNPKYLTIAKSRRFVPLINEGHTTILLKLFQDVRFFVESDKFAPLTVPARREKCSSIFLPADHTFSIAV